MSETENDSLDFDATVTLIQPTNGKHWYCKIPKLFSPKKNKAQNAAKANNSVLERSSSSISATRVEERMYKELRYFFMNPCQKYRAKKRKPFKLAIQIFKIALVTLQLVIFGRNNQDLVNFKNDTNDVLYKVFLNRSTYFYTKTDVYNQLNYIRKQYSSFENITLGNFAYYNSLGKVGANCSNVTANHKRDHSACMCVYEYKYLEADLDDDRLIYNASGTRSKCYCLQPWLDREKVLRSNLSVPLSNGSAYHINFHRMNQISVHMGIRTVRAMPSHSYHSTDCYDIIVTATLQNKGHTGRISLELDSQFSVSPCPHTNVTGKDLAHKPTAILLLFLDLIIIIHCTASLLLCLRSLWRGQRLRKSFERFYWKRYKKKLQWFVKFEFFNFWYFLIIISDILTILGSITKIVIEMEWKGVINYDLCSVFLGVGCLCVWVGVLRYAGFFHQYNILVLTLKKSLPHVLRFMVCASVLYLGFMFCGWVVLGPYHHKFRDPVVTSEALFSLINGDDMYMTYEEMSKKSSLAWVFSQIYLYVFISLFIYIVLSLFIAVIMDTYETIKEWQRENFPPQNDIQRFLAEHGNPNGDDTQYYYNSDAYCCCCLYHNNDPDIECHSSDDEEVIEG